ncbi:ammonium transporter [Pseudemcibacter aquimaris]|uniref:ammonium transporter n=1 Tax=Pseudemcibacter aquimaris TaxID=2857064 RepID=UPI002010CE8A|nr:ammonium transporter [Pseudemcibacter aquimaris]MCC3861683.1 ammonium transporter [Pseudemcibacter aquimaris]WDU58454.1 ammonium transporter [Pseudemcibacter aquimaris]
METLKTGTDVFFILIGAILVFAMHAGFAFLEVGSVRKKNQVNALVKIISDFAVSTIVYFFIGYQIAYGINFFNTAEMISGIGESSPFTANGYDMVKFFFLLTFAAAIPAIISGGIAERSRFKPQLLATAILVGFLYPVFEGMVWNDLMGFQDWLSATFGHPFHDFAGSVVVHTVGGWMALGAIVMLGARTGRYRKDGTPLGIPPSNIPFLALGSWILCIGWFGFNVMSAGEVSTSSGLVALNSLMAMAGGILSSLYIGKQDPGFIHNGALAGLVAVCAGSDLMHPLGALIVGLVAGAIFVKMFTICGNRWKIDDVLGVWPLHGICGVWGGISAGIFGSQTFWGLGGVSIMSQIIGTFVGALFAFASGLLVFGLLKITIGIRLSKEDEYLGADLSIHRISATPEEDFGLR